MECRRAKRGVTQRPSKASIFRREERSNGSNAADKSSKMKTQKWPLDLAMEVIGNLGKSNLGRVEGMKAGRGWTKEKKSCR